MPRKRQIEITKEQFRIYQRAQYSGRWNMLLQAHEVMVETYLTREEYLLILDTYGQLLDKYGDLDEDNNRSIPGGSV